MQISVDEDRGISIMEIGRVINITKMEDVCRLLEAVEDLMRNKDGMDAEEIASDINSAVVQIEEHFL